MPQKYYDISPEISEEIAVFPGDVGFSRKIALDMKKGHNLTLSSITTTLHLGAHADAPSHYLKNGQDIASRSLEIYKGPAQVIHVKINAGERIQPRHIKDEKIRAERVLFCTETFVNPNRWYNEFAALSPELINVLVKNYKVKLVGIDTPSIDPSQSKALESHQAVAENDLAILEGLVLSHVPADVYELVALPLKIKGADASPVRAVLFKL